MTGRSGSRLPRDVRARERLRAAQQAEAAAVAAVVAAQEAMRRSESRHAEAIANAQARVDKARAVLTDAQAGLVRVSGLDRAAGVLGVSRAALRRTVAAARAGARDAR